MPHPSAQMKRSCADANFSALLARCTGKPERVSSHLSSLTPQDLTDFLSYDNSGQKMTYPTWQTNQENVERTERCIETIASLAANSSAATVVAPLNESVTPSRSDLMRITDL